MRHFSQPAPPTLFCSNLATDDTLVGHFGQMTFFPQSKIHFGWASLDFSDADQDKTISLIRLGRDLRNGGKKQDCQKKILELSLFVLFPFLYRGNFLRMKATWYCKSLFGLT